MDLSQSQHVEQFIRLFFAGVGLLLVGGVNLVLTGTRSRVLASAAVVGVVLGGYAAWQSNVRDVGRVAGVIGLVLAPVVLLGSRRLVAVGAAVARLVQRPSVRWGALAVCGLGVVAVGGIRFTLQDEQALEKGMDELDLMTKIPDLQVIERVPAKTDRGVDVVMRRPLVPRNRAELDYPEDKALRGTGYDQFVIRREPARDESNCHGWVFTGGQYWVRSEDVQSILDDNGYAPVTTPRAGDLVIYRNAVGVAHTGVVRYIADGQPVMIESKWAWMGVFLHPVHKSVYGDNFAYYRSPRDGHVLAGLGR